MSEQQKKYWGVHWVENLQMDNKLRLKQIVLWIFAFLWLTFCFYLSWQTGEETVGLSLQIARWCYDLLSNLHFTVELESLHMQLRLFAHFGVFFVTGLLMAGAFLVTFPQRKRFLTFCVAVILCAIIAVLAEVGKLQISGRHLTWSEAGLNVLGALCGVGCVYFIQFFKRRVQMRN